MLLQYLPAHGVDLLAVRVRLRSHVLRKGSANGTRPRVCTSRKRTDTEKWHTQTRAPAIPEQKAMTNHHARAR